MITKEELDLALTNEATFKTFIHDANDVVAVAHEFRDRAEELIQFILINPEIFKSVFKRFYDFELLSVRFPNYKEEFALPLLNDSDIFKKVIIGAFDVECFSSLFPEHKEELIKPVLSDPGIFKQVVKGEMALKKLKKMYPNHEDVFGKPDVTQAFNVVKSRSKESEEFTRGATIGALSGGEHSGKLPPEVTSHISRFLTRREGGNLAGTNQAANFEGKNLEEKEKNRPAPKKK